MHVVLVPMESIRSYGGGERSIEAYGRALRVIDTIVLRKFRDGQYAEGIDAGVAGTISNTRGLLHRVAR